MRLLVVHNYYRQAGGEDRVLADECAMLESHRHEVIRYTAHNDSIQEGHNVAVALKTVWNGAVYREVRALLQERRPDVVHCHNTFPLVSPAVYYAASAERVPVVQTLHNYRLLCPAALLYRAGTVCESCIGTVPWRGIVHGCYRQSRGASAAAVAMIVSHRALGTWTKRVNVYVALSRFARTKFIDGGLPASTITVKPNFVYPDPGVGNGDGGYALFVGRLSPEKGIRTLLEAWRSLGSLVPLKIVGDGPLAREVRAAADTSAGIVEWVGHRQPSEVAALLGRATFLVCPSEWHETFGRVVVEAFAAGTPVLASRLGALAELIDHGRTGRLFAAGRAEALVEQATLLLSDPGQLSEMRRRARSEFEAKYTMAHNYTMLRDIYRRAQERPSCVNAESQVDHLMQSTEER